MTEHAAHGPGSQEPNPADIALLAQLREALAEVDPVPEVLLDAARGSFTWRSIDAELAELVADSALQAAAVRSAAAVTERLLTFTAGDITVVVEVESEAEGGGRVRRLAGQLVPPRAAVIEVRQPDGNLTVTADELGRFRAEGVPAGPLQLACRFAGGTLLVTDWVTV